LECGRLGRKRSGSRCPGSRSSSCLAPLRSGLSHRQLDAAPGDLSLGVLHRHEIKVLLCDLKPSMRSNDIRVFDVLVVQVAELPVCLLGPLRVLEVSDLAENGHLLNQTLESTNVDG